LYSIAQRLKGKYLVADKTGEVSSTDEIQPEDDTDAIGLPIRRDGRLFYQEDYGQNTISLKTIHGTFLRAEETSVGT